jgi:CheY-like chemotaxis protein
MSKAGAILIVEDEEDLVEILSDIVGRVSDTVYTARNGKEALEVLASHQVHAVLSDIMMPVMNGLELLRTVRQGGSDVPFVFLTAFGDKHNLLEALRLGALDFIEKPFEIETVRTATANALELGVALQDLEKELDAIVSKSKLPMDEVARMRNIRRAVLMMKLECEIYAKKQLK